MILRTYELSELWQPFPQGAWLERQCLKSGQNVWFVQIADRDTQISTERRMRTGAEEDLAALRAQVKQSKMAEVARDELFAAKEK